MEIIMCEACPVPVMKAPVVVDGSHPGLSTEIFGPVAVSEVKPIAAVKRGRGRPRKYPAGSRPPRPPPKPPVYDANGNVKRGRGRPRKNALPATMGCTAAAKADVKPTLASLQIDRRDSDHAQASSSTISSSNEAADSHKVPRARSPSFSEGRARRSCILANPHLKYSENRPKQYLKGNASAEPTGITVFENFISEEEEIYLERLYGGSKLVDPKGWSSGLHSVSNWDRRDMGKDVLYPVGHYGSKVPQTLPDPPECKVPIIKRIQERIEGLQDFNPDYIQCNRMVKSEGHSISPHYDHLANFGPKIIVMSLMGDCYIKFVKESRDRVCKVFAPRRSLYMMEGAARGSIPVRTMNWMHGIDNEDLQDEYRFSIVLRTLTTNNKRSVAASSKLLKSQLEDESVEILNRTPDKDGNIRRAIRKKRYKY